MEGVDVLFHQAAIRITQCAEEPRLALEVLVDGTFNVLEAAAAAGGQEGRGGLVGIGLRPGRGLPHRRAASSLRQPDAVRRGQAVQRGPAPQLPRDVRPDYVALRYFNVYGPRMDIHGAYTEVLIRWMERIAAEQPPIIFGDGSQTMDFVYVEDIARANILAARSPVTDEVFNVASGVETSLDDLAKTLLRVMDSDLAPQYGPERKVNPVPRRLA